MNCIDTEIRINFLEHARDSVMHLKRLLSNELRSNPFHQNLLKKTLRELASLAASAEYPHLSGLFDTLKGHADQLGRTSSVQHWLNELLEVVEVLRNRPDAKFDLTFFQQEIVNELKSIASRPSRPRSNDDQVEIEEMLTDSEFGSRVESENETREVTEGQLNFYTGKITVLYPQKSLPKVSDNERRIGQLGAELYCLSESWEGDLGRCTDKTLKLHTMVSELRDVIENKLNLSFPLLDVLVIRSFREQYLISAKNVCEVLPAKKDSVCIVEGNACLQLASEVVPIVSLRKVLGHSQKRGGEFTKSFVVIQCHEKKLGLLVDEVMSARSVVLKEMAEEFLINQLYSGVAILDSEIALILNIEELAMAGSDICERRKVANDVS